MPRSAVSTRERVLRAADRLWGEHGLRGVSLAAIAREASVTKPAVYYYFADKSALLTAVVTSVLEQHGAALRRAARGATARERLIGALGYLVSARCNGPRLLRDGGVALTVDQTSQARGAFFRQFFSPVQQILDDGVRSGELRRVDTAFTTQALLNLVDPWTGREPPPGGRDATQLATEIVSLVVDGLAT